MKFSLIGILCGILLITSISCSSDENPNGDIKLASKAYLFATTVNGIVKRYDINDGSNKPSINISSTSASKIIAEGIASFAVLSLEPGRIESYENLSIPDKTGSIDANTDFTSTVTFQHPTDLEKSEGFYVVSDTTDFDGDLQTEEGRILIFKKSETGFEIRNMVLTDFKVVGMEFVGEDLYVIKSHSNKVAVFRNFLDSYQVFSRAVAEKTVRIEGALQLSSLDFENGTMFLADMGDPGINGDGAIHSITGFESKFVNTPGSNIIPAVGQLVISGNNTQLGNPVDIKYDASYNAVFVAEAASAGGRIIAFNRADSVEGNISPDLSYKLSGVTSVDFYTE
ncbi:hypothetical protein [Christiangramia fulva]|nr:hypothetical protein [Christiangramia fulva]